MSKKILVADDDPNIRDVIRFALEKSGFQVQDASDGQETLDLLNKSNPDLIILDITMPEKDGLEVCRTVRRHSDIPILFLSSHDDEIDRIVGLEIGGDDYVTKPFSPRELVARVNAILKRIQPKNHHATVANQLSYGCITLDDENHTAYWNDTAIELTVIEFSILKTMMQHPNKVYSRDDIMHHAYEYNINVSDRTIDSHIRNIRHKYAAVDGKNIIETVRGIGYRLGACQK
ncbi:MAG: response regulator transcription factor [Rickettsiales bacterium]|nr:response regulator transcription factor [Rickettsiales bacterium]